MNVLRLLPAALVLAGCAHTPESADAGTTKIDALRTAARAAVRSVASKPVKVAMTVECAGEMAVDKLAKKADEPAP